eukprot:CAMPEP_0198142630 /NCGR_PEP_ID=MMETSP1443-20131203/5377_1 /TAXON_ID=186043 /ORGANISM="Entomoneis sp., Strain CCMP2396" /LENGTH=274 /DNA_ID=CAMNT_0043805687 /DNA_START=26 /DNA_END=850 /DNA_ORIENTATION=-
MACVDYIQAMLFLGCDHLYYSELDEAMQVFSEILSGLSSLCLLPTPVSGGGGGGGGSAHPPGRVFDASWQNAHAAPTIRFSGPEGSQLEDTQEQFFPNPFATAPANDHDTEEEHLQWRCPEKSSTFTINSDNDNQEDEKQLTNQEYNAFAITALFNLGLCYHLQWFTEAPNQSILLVKALWYYRQAFYLVTPERFISSRQDPVLKVLCMAVCGNATHVSLELGQLDQVKMWNQRLSNIVARRTTIMYQEDDEDARFFLRHATIHSFAFVAARAA